MTIWGARPKVSRFVHLLFFDLHFVVFFIPFCLFRLLLLLWLRAKALSWTTRIRTARRGENGSPWRNDTEPSTCDVCTLRRRAKWQTI